MYVKSALYTKPHYKRVFIWEIFKFYFFGDDINAQGNGGMCAYCHMNPIDIRRVECRKFIFCVFELVN